MTMHWWMLVVPVLLLVAVLLGYLVAHDEGGQRK
jgi:hypothetical protein